MDKQNMLKAFNDNDEKMLFSKILDLVVKCNDKSFSDFIDPARADKYIALLTSQRDFDLSYMAYGGDEDCERKMLGFSQSYDELNSNDFPIDAIEVSYNSNFNRKLSHRDFLGSLTGLGIDRSRVGDIIITDGGCLVYISREIAGYVCANLEKVGSVKVGVKPAEPSVRDINRHEGTDKRLTLASLRIDNVISAAFKFSRSKSADLISGEKVYVNWGLVKNGSKSVVEGDKITLRGYGRVMVKEVIGTTKKDRIAVILSIY